jgi:predicted amidophosphoribosyltransferase
LLIDDVLTSGATVGECARTLKRAGASAVDVLTLARVVIQEGV